VVKIRRVRTYWQGLVRFAVTPPPKKGKSTERFAAQLALARVHPCLIALERTPGGYAIPRDATRGWFELYAQRGLAGYGLARALRILLDVLSGISALEDTRTESAQPFVHGELVPAMLRVDPSGTTRVIPLAPWHWSEPSTLPATERCGHLAPERLLGDAIDARADVFSAGVLLWEALAGRRLFATDSVDRIVTRLLGGKVILPELPPELSWAVPLKAVAMCALSVDPEQRFANCAELAAAIEAVARDQVATHGDVFDYFSSPDRTMRPSVSARPPSSLPAHHSSLSALVAPARPLMSAEPSAPVSPKRDSVRPKRGTNPPLWAIAGISCLLGALGVSAVARYRALGHESHAVVQGVVSVVSAPQPAAPLSSAAPSLAVAPAPVEAAVPVEAAAAPVPSEPARERHDKPKSKKVPNTSKGQVPKLRAPAKAARSPDKTAAKYGI